MSCVDASLLLPFLLASGVAALASCGLSLATLRGVRDLNFESPHDGEADAVREAQAGVIQALVHVEGRLLHGLVRADDVDDAAGQEQAREANGPRRTQPDPDQRDRFVQDVMGREEPWPVAQVPALDRPGVPVGALARILQGVK